MRYGFKKIKFRRFVLFLILLLFLVVSVFLMILESNVRSNNLRDEEIETVSTYVRSRVSSIDRFVENRRDDMSFFSLQGEVEKKLMYDNISKEILDDLVEEYNFDERYSNVMILDEGGDIVWNYSNENVSIVGEVLDSEMDVLVIGSSFFSVMDIANGSLIFVSDVSDFYGEKIGEYNFEEYVVGGGKSIIQISGEDLPVVDNCDVVEGGYYFLGDELVFLENFDEEDLCLIVVADKGEFGSGLKLNYYYLIFPVIGIIIFWVLYRK